MTSQLPPDRDPNLRAAMSLSQEDQIRLLNTLAGESLTMRTPAGGGHGFTHYGGITKTSPRGALVYLPTPIPPNVADPDATTLMLTVDHKDLDRKVLPRHPTMIAKLTTTIDTALPLRGTHELRIHTPPRRWTAAHLEWFARTMAGYLPPSPTPGPINFDVYGFKSDSIELMVRRNTEWNAFRVACEFSPIGIRTALNDWHTTTGGWSATIGNEPLPTGPEPPDTADRSSAPDDDDDLDSIERACRQQLHGITRQTRATKQPAAPLPTQAAAGRTLCNLLDIALECPDAFAQIANIVNTIHEHIHNGGRS